MIKVNLITNAGRKTDIVAPSTTLREIYERNGVNYAAATNTVDSVPLQIGQLDKTLEELGVGSEVRITSVVKMDNAATVHVVANAAVLFSSVTLEDWKRALKYDPRLGVYNDDDEIEFAVSIDENSPGSIDSNGVIFSGSTDKDGHATVTILLSPDVEDKVAAVAEQIGPALMDLKTLEDSMPEVLADAKKFEEEIRNSIVEM